MKIPTIDLGRAHRRIAGELEQRWRRVLADTSFVLGPEVAELEHRFAELLGAAGCVGVANGTDALVLALQALGIRRGDEVIVPAFSFFATAEAVVLTGGRVVFADVEPESLNLDPADVAAQVSERTVGVIGVHLSGRPFDVEALGGVCEHRGLWLLEDAAQAHGARWRGRRVGSFGRLAAWSFYPTKNFGCYGDGGAVTGMDGELLSRLRRLANHGQEGRYHHLEVGTNSRLDSLQAAVLNCRLATLDADNARRRAIAGRYREALAGVGDLRWPVDRDETEPVYHQLALLTAHRDALAGHLAAASIGSAVHYPSPLHRQPAMETLGGEPPALPVAERAAREVLCLPIFPELEDTEVDAVCDRVRDFFAG